ncbi:hypothetical protein Y032_0002g756 [Ancylostoma ceylanicum]|uniref:Uncharacterized protein n=1 Tax=Ancylostoma ceylanicum TaxID=53326 RepID=A0A016W142_9BILA|nr:hypothetical protein Y032_0002g756 [Ancylostoma ceylanicum]
MKNLRVKDKVVGVDQSRHVGCGPHSISSGNRKGIECVCALYSDLRGEADVPSQCFILPDSFGTNLPTPEGWIAELAMGAIKLSTVSVRSDPLTIAPQTPHKNLEVINNSVS